MQSGYVGRVQSRLKSISPARARIIRGNLRRISRKAREGDGIFLSPRRRANREQKFLSEGSMFVSRMEKERKNDTILEGMAVAVVVYATFFFFFCPPVFFTTKVNVTNGQRSIGPNDLVLSETRVLSPRCEEDRNPADGEIAGTG